MKFDAQQGVTNLLNAPDIQYLAPRVQTFLTDHQTREIAANLLEQMVIAAQLFQEGEFADAIAGLLINPIERSLWAELVTTLNEQSPGRRNFRQPDIQWVWALAEDEWQLRIRNFVSEKRPFEAVWHSVTDGKKVIVDIQPWQRDDGIWYVDELLLAGGPLDGEVAIYDPQDKKLMPLTPPNLPLGDFVAYRITQQGQFAIPVDTRLGLNNGYWLFSSRAGIKIQELGGQGIDPIQTDFYIPQSFREISGHRQAALYRIDFPAVITVEGHEEVIAKRSGTIGQPWLTGDDPVSDLSLSVPPTFTSRNIALHFPELMDEVLRFSLVIQANHTILRWNLDELVHLFSKEGDNDNCFLDLAPLLESIVGTFTLDIQRGLRSVLVAPLQCTLLPDMTIVGPNPDHVYWKDDLPSAWVSNIERDQIQGENVQISVEGRGYRVIWDDLRQAEYRILLHFAESQVVLAWKLQRHFAFLDKLGSDQTIAFENLKDATLTIYGLPNEAIVFNVQDEVFNAQLESHRRAESKLVMPFARHRIMDFIQAQAGENVPLQIRLGEHQWLIGTITRDVPIKISESRPKPPQMPSELKIESSSERVFKQKLSERMDLIHKPAEWIKHYGLLPAWAVTSKNLLFRYAVPKYNYRIPIIPETLAFEGRTGYGHILLKLDGFRYERNFAKWEQNPRGGADLRVKIPMQEPTPQDSFEQLSDDDLDGMWSAYKCTVCGEIFGNRLSSVATQRHKQLHAHGHAEAKRFHDLFYNTPQHGDILVEKWNFLDDPIIPYTHYFDVAWTQSREAASENENSAYRPAHPLKIEAYKAATLQRLFQRAENPSEYGLLLENPALANFQENIKKHMPSQPIPPMVSASLRLLNLIAPSPNFDTQIVSLALWKRIQDIYSPLARQLEAKIGLEKQQTQALIQIGTRICPDLLLWAFSWIELCYIHAKE